MKNTLELNDAGIKAAYIRIFGNDSGWEDYAGSYFIEGYRAALAIAPVADERAAFEAEYVDHCGMRLEDYDFDYDPATNRYRDDCEQSAWWGWHTGRAALASAPAAGDARPFAVLAVHKNGEIRSYSTGQALQDAPIQDSERELQRKYGYELVTVYTAPQASADARNAARYCAVRECPSLVMSLGLLSGGSDLDARTDAYLADEERGAQ